MNPMKRMSGDEPMKAAADQCKHCGDVLAQGVCRRCVMIAIFGGEKPTESGADAGPEVMDVDGRLENHGRQAEPVEDVRDSL